jgi:hypothetical protein
MRKLSDQELEKRYDAWLEEYCECNPSSDDCDCPRIEDWLHEMEASLYESMSIAELEEECG